MKGRQLLGKTPPEFTWFLSLWSGSWQGHVLNLEIFYTLRGWDGADQMVIVTKRRKTNYCKLVEILHSEYAGIILRSSAKSLTECSQLKYLKWYIILKLYLQRVLCNCTKVKSVELFKSHKESSS